jgi:hypothetical protein
MRKNRILQLSFLLAALLLGTVMALNVEADIYPCRSEMSCAEAEAACNGTPVYQYVGICYDSAYPGELYLYPYYNFTCNGTYWGTCTGI